MKKILAFLAGLVVVSYSSGTLVSCNVINNVPNANDNALYTFLTELQDLDSGSKNIFTVPDISYNKATKKTVEDYLAGPKELNLAKFKNRFKIECQSFKDITQQGSDKNFMFAPGQLSFKVKDTIYNNYVSLSLTNKDLFTINFFTNDANKANNIKNNLALLNQKKEISLSSLSVVNLLDSFTSVFGINLKDFFWKIIDANPAIANILKSFLAMPLGQLIDRIKSFLPAIGIQTPVPTTIPTNPTFDQTGMLQDEAWDKFYYALQEKVASYINPSVEKKDSNNNLSAFSFSDIIVPAINKNFSSFGVEAGVSSQQTNLQVIINSLAPDIIHFLNFCINLPNNSDYTLAGIQYFLSATTRQFKINDNMANVNVDLVKNGQIQTNLDNLLFDLFGNEQIANSQNNKVNVAWHHDENSNTGATIPFSFTLQVKILTLSKTLKIGYFNSEFYDSSNKLTLVKEPLVDLSLLFKEFISGLFFSQTNDTDLLNNKINLFNVINISAIIKGLLGDHWYSWLSSLLSEVIKSALEAVMQSEYHLDGENISLNYFYQSILDDYLIANGSDLTNYSLNFLILKGELTSSSDNKNFHSVANLEDLINSNDLYWNFDLLNIEGQYLYKLQTDILLNCNFSFQNIVFHFI